MSLKDMRGVAKGRRGAGPGRGAEAAAAASLHRPPLPRGAGPGTAADAPESTADASSLVGSPLPVCFCEHANPAACMLGRRPEPGPAPPRPPLERGAHLTRPLPPPGAATVGPAALNCSGAPCPQAPAPPTAPPQILDRRQARPPSPSSLPLFFLVLSTPPPPPSTGSLTPPLRDPASPPLRPTVARTAAARRPPERGRGAAGDRRPRPASSRCRRCARGLRDAAAPPKPPPGPGLRPNGALPGWGGLGGGVFNGPGPSVDPSIRRSPESPQAPESPESPQARIHRSPESPHRSIHRSSE